MNTVEYLKQLRYINTVIKQKLNEQKELEDRIYNVPVNDYSRLKVKTSNKPSYDLITKFINESALLSKEIAEYENKRKHIVSEIRQLHKTEYIEVLYKRYVEFKNFDIIAAEMKYSKSNIWKIHRKAIKDFEKLVVNYSKRE